MAGIAVTGNFDKFPIFKAAPQLPSSYLIGWAATTGDASGGDVTVTWTPGAELGAIAILNAYFLVGATTNYCARLRTAVTLFTVHEEILDATTPASAPASVPASRRFSVPTILPIRPGATIQMMAKNANLAPMVIGFEALAFDDDVWTQPGGPSLVGLGR